MSAVDDMFKKWNSTAKYQLAQSGVSWEKVDRIPVSSPRISYLTYGGLPCPGLVELSGPESSGKTLLALDAVANAQKKWPDRDVVWFDIEATFDSRWAALQGVDIRKIKYVCPQEEYGEEIFQMVIDLLENKDTDISLIVLDSVAALISKQEYEKDQDEATMGGIAKPLTRFCNRLAPLLRKKHCTFIAINQVREDMNSMYGNETTPGGRGLRHTASMRLQLRKSDNIDEAGNIISSQAENPAGHLVKVKILKTKVSRPDRKLAFYTLRYLTGIDAMADLIDVGVKLKVFRQAGAWFYAPDENGEEKGFQGKAKFRAFLEENPESYKMYWEHINAQISKEDDEEEARYMQSLLESDEKDS